LPSGICKDAARDRGREARAVCDRRPDVALIDLPGAVRPLELGDELRSLAERRAARDPAGALRLREGRRELQAGQGPVARLRIALVRVPAAWLAQPRERVVERARPNVAPPAHGGEQGARAVAVVVARVAGVLRGPARHLAREVLDRAS